MSRQTRRQCLDNSGLAHPHPEAVTAELFAGNSGFFLALDKVQVKYEMLRAHILDGVTVTSAAGSHGYSRGEFYLVAAAFEESGMAGLLDERRGRKGPTKLTAEVRSFLDGLSDRSATQAAAELESALGVRLHPRSIQRARHT